MEKLNRRIDLFKALPHGSVGAEIGVWRGYFSIEILNNTSVKKIYLVDAWKTQPGYNDPLTDTDHEANLEECKHHLRGHVGRWEIVRSDSVKAADRFRNGPLLDWVYIDADHSYQACLDDLIAWSDCIKHGGCIMGHDYTNNDQAKKWNFGVIEAVNDFCNEYGWTMTAITNEDFASYRLERNNFTGAEL